MGSGKSTLGKKVSLKLNQPFFDLDTEIEKGEQLSVSQIFELKGEASFRDLETQYLKQIIDKNESFVMALGGGTPCFNENMELINGVGVSIYLKYNSGILATRLLNAKTQRPLLKDKTPEQLKQFVDEKLLEREFFYKQATIGIEGANLKAEDVIASIAANNY